MTGERKKLGFELLLDNFLSNLGRMILVNLIFAVPLFLSLALAYVLYLYVIPVAPVILPLSLLFSSPFYSGVVVLTREYSQGNRPRGILRTYLKSFKENWLQFLLNGLILYVAFVGCFFSIKIYYSMAQSSWIFYFLFFIAIFIAIFFLFLFYAVFLMSASFDLKLKDIYKNSALMTFGELKNNFFSTVVVLAYLAVVLMPVIAIFYLASMVSADTVLLLLFIYICFALAVLIPAPCAMIVSNFLYPNMRAVIAGDDISAENSSAPAPDIKSVADTAQEVPDVNIDEIRKGDGEEYIFYNGKMMKRKVIIKLLESKEEKENEE